MNHDARILRDDIRFCREPSCRRPIVFAETPAGKVCPIDVEPTTDPKVAKYYLAAWQIATTPRYLLAPASEAEPDDPLFSSHFATCTKASQFSKKGKA